MRQSIIKAITAKATTATAAPSRQLTRTKHMNRYAHLGHRDQRGTVFIMGLVTMTAMAMVAMLGMSGPISQEVLARNGYDKVKMRIMAESLNEYALDKDSWVEDTLEVSKDGLSMSYTVNDAAIAGSQALSEYELNVDLKARVLNGEGNTINIGSTGKLVLMNIRSEVQSKSNPDEISIMNKGSLRLVASQGN